MDKIIDEKEVALDCDSCDSSTMIMRINPYGEDAVHFSCSSCEQHYRFHPGGRYNYTLATIWPSSMKETDAKYRDEFIPWQLKLWKFIAKAKFHAGFFTEQEMEDDIEEAEKVIADWYDAHPVPIKPWWKFW